MLGQAECFLDYLSGPNCYHKCSSKGGGQWEIDYKIGSQITHIDTAAGFEDERLGAMCTSLNENEWLNPIG